MIYENDEKQKRIAELLRNRLPFVEPSDSMMDIARVVLALASDLPLPEDDVTKAAIEQLRDSAADRMSRGDWKAVDP